MCHHGQPPPPPPSTWCLITSAFPSPLSVHPGSFIVPPTHILLFHLNTSNMCFHLHPVFVHASFHLSIYPSLGHLYTSPPPAVSLPATISPDTTSPQDLSMLTPGQIKLGFWEFHPSFVFPGNTQAPFSHEYSDYCAHPPQYIHAASLLIWDRCNSSACPCLPQNNSRDKRGFVFAPCPSQQSLPGSII